MDGDWESLYFFSAQGSVSTDEIVIRAMTAVPETALLDGVQPGQTLLILIINVKHDAFAGSVK